MLGLFAKKVGMTTIFGEDGAAIPVTVMRAGPCKVVQVKTPDLDKYSALQLGFEPTNKRVTKPKLGHFKKARVQPHKKIGEFRVPPDIAGKYKAGDTIDVSIFEAGNKVSCTGTTKGKGFQGTVRRWKFGGGPKTHGQKDKFRAPGSIGASATPSKVIKGMKMAGQMGNARRTIKGLSVVKVDQENNLLLVKGSVPGAKGGFIKIVQER
ncbi:MAG: 50S ribosomal protein L3 [Candidatus Zixiibacteriota bacterium]